METLKANSVDVPVMTDLEYAIHLMTTGRKDDEFQFRACERMDRVREELRRKIGTIEVAVDLIRDARDEE